MLKIMIMMIDKVSEGPDIQRLPWDAPQVPQTQEFSRQPSRHSPKPAAPSGV